MITAKRQNLISMNQMVLMIGSKTLLMQKVEDRLKEILTCNVACNKLDSIVKLPRLELCRMVSIAILLILIR